MLNFCLFIVTMLFSLWLFKASKAPVNLDTFVRTVWTSNCHNGSFWLFLTKADLFMTFQSLKGASEFGHFCSYSLNFQLSQWLFLAIFDDNLPKPDFFIAFQSLSGANEFGHFCLYLLDWQLSQWLFFWLFLVITCQNPISLWLFKASMAPVNLDTFVCIYPLDWQLSQWLFLAIFGDKVSKPDFFSKPLMALVNLNTFICTV